VRMGLAADARQPSWSKDLIAGPDAPSQARWFLNGAVAHLRLDEELSISTLLISELTSNAVRHGRRASGSWIGLTITDTGPFVRVAVCDQGPGFDLAEIDWRGHKGGLFLVDALSYDWGIERSASGTEVWFEI
jgi:anti-sigma regulatory factor (Ser/Thr protein kinase)